MLYVKTPLRISFSGGMTDFPQFFNKYNGSVVSVTIDKYIRIMLNQKFEPGIRLMYSTTENTDLIKDIKHSLFRETLKYYKITKNIEIASVGDIPSKGSGLGSSAAFLVGLIRILNIYKRGKDIDKNSNANLAYHIENNKCKMTCGLQDHFASSYCGLNQYIFKKNNVITKKIKISDEFLKKLEKSIKLFYLNKTAQSHKISDKNINLIKNKDNLRYLMEILDLSRESKKYLEEENIRKFSKTIDASWQLKKRYQKSFINYDECDDFINYAKKKGAYCGKLLGAGMRGFVMIIGPNSKLKNITDHTNFKSFSPKFVMNRHPIIKI